MTSIAERIPVDEISDRAREIHFAKTMLTIVAALFYVIGWIVGKVWLGFVWCLVAVKVGFMEAKNGRPGAEPSR